MKRKTPRPPTPGAQSHDDALLDEELDETFPASDPIPWTHDPQTPELYLEDFTVGRRFETADVALIIGANDVVNPVARTDKSSPIYGMPILNADKAKNVIVIKRGQGAGFSGIENALFYLDNTRMLYGDGQAKAAELVQAVKTL